MSRRGEYIRIAVSMLKSVNRVTSLGPVSASLGPMSKGVVVAAQRQGE